MSTEPTAPSAEAMAADKPFPDSTMKRNLSGDEVRLLKRELSHLSASLAAAQAERDEAREESILLRKQNDQRIEDFLNERHCCTGQECACMGITRLEQYVAEECGSRIGALRTTLTQKESDLAKATAEVGRLREALEAASGRMAYMAGAFGNRFSVEDKNLNREVFVQIRAALLPPTPAPSAEAMAATTERRPLKYCRGTIDLVTRDQFIMLKESGMMGEFYPDAPDTWDQLPLNNETPTTNTLHRRVR